MSLAHVPIYIPDQQGKFRLLQDMSMDEIDAAPYPGDMIASDAMRIMLAQVNESLAKAGYWQTVQSDAYWSYDIRSKYKSMILMAKVLLFRPNPKGCGIYGGGRRCP